jgi:hypothetical protein
MLCAKRYDHLVAVTATGSGKNGCTVLTGKTTSHQCSIFVMVNARAVRPWYSGALNMSRMPTRPRRQYHRSS